MRSEFWKGAERLALVHLSRSPVMGIVHYTQLPTLCIRRLSCVPWIAIVSRFARGYVQWIPISYGFTVS